MMTGASETCLGYNHGAKRNTQHYATTVMLHNTDDVHRAMSSVGFLLKVMLCAKHPQT